MTSTIVRPAGGWEPSILAALHGGLPSRPALGLSESIASRLAAWLDLAVTWNRHAGLTGARSSDELVDLFVGDAVAVEPASRRLSITRAGSWVDVGSGGGAPGIALALLGLRVTTLIEPKSKRVAFLRTSVGSLHLDIAVRRARAAHVEDGSFDVAISRATMAPGRWLAEGTRIARRAVWVLLAREDPPILPGWTLTVDHAYELPLTGSPRRAVCYVNSGVSCS